MTNDELEVVKACNAEMIKELLKLSQSNHIFMSFIVQRGLRGEFQEYCNELQANL